MSVAGQGGSGHAYLTLPHRLTIATAATGRLCQQDRANLWTFVVKLVSSLAERGGTQAGTPKIQVNSTLCSNMSLELLSVAKHSIRVAGQTQQEWAA